MEKENLCPMILFFFNKNYAYSFGVDIEDSTTFFHYQQTQKILLPYTYIIMWLTEHLNYEE